MMDSITRPAAATAPGTIPDKRMNRICQLLSKAVLRDWTSRVVVEDRPAEKVDRRLGGSEAADGARILAYLGLIGEASPATIRETTGLARMRVYRALQPLLADGRIVALGMGRTTRYRVSYSEAAKSLQN